MRLIRALRILEVGSGAFVRYPALAFEREGASIETLKKGASSLVLTCAMLLALPAASTCQNYPRVEVALTGGPAKFDFGAVGWTQVYAVRLPFNLIRWVVIEPGLTSFDYRDVFGRDHWYLVPEVQLQFTPFEGRARPYMGVGYGRARRVAISDGYVGSLSVAGGLRLEVGNGWAVVGELRGWNIGVIEGAVGAFGVGLSRRFRNAHSIPPNGAANAR